METISPAAARKSHQKNLPEQAHDKLFGFRQSFTFNYLLHRKLSCITQTAPDAAK
ncbi:hypothetical protein [Chlorobaculum tepidum]|jgi:hypothetical protein|uniref:hypothetical protein n=1 Tax=Chlorobaculum tepidum TaxID=1097 RepID=UPI0013E8CDF8|nr:hypothetical protein [Chlorobaculum tepidum]